MGRTSPKISVVVPVYNMAGYLPDAVESVLRGDFDDFEVLIVDDGSTDGTRDAAAQFSSVDGRYYDPRVRYLRKPNSGKATAVNFALREVRGAFVTFLDADDELTPGSLSVRYQAAAKRGRTDEIVIGGFEVFDDSDVLGSRSVPSNASVRSLKRQFWLSYKTPFHLNACLVPRALINKAGSFDPRLRRCEDIDYSMRLLDHTNSALLIRAMVYRYRKHRASARERVHYRMRTMRERPMVFWKNCQGLSKMPAIAAGLALDAGKAAYELVSNYER